VIVTATRSEACSHSAAGSGKDWTAPVTRRSLGPALAKQPGQFGFTGRVQKQGQVQIPFSTIFSTTKWYSATKFLSSLLEQSIALQWCAEGTFFVIVA